MPATMRDIKEETGLSFATISKYLNGGNVLPENKVKIEAAVKKLHYEVNEIARGLVTNKTRTVGVVVFNIESLFNGTLLRYIGAGLRQAGYAMMICDSCNDEAIERDNVRFLISKKVDGIIVVPVGHSSGFLKQAKKAEIPVVLLDRILEDEESDCVRINNSMAAFRAVRLLLEKHHKKIAVITSATEYTGVERYRGFMDAMQKAGLEVPEDYQKKGLHSIEHGHDGMAELLKLRDRPTAVFTTNYEITLGAIMALNETGYKCPNDISILGFDNLLLSHIVEPQITMVVQPMKEIAEKGTELLIRRIQEKDGEKEPPMEIIVGTYIQPGNSIKDLAIK